MALAEVVSGAVEAVGPERRRLQLAVEGAEGNDRNFIGNFTRRDVLPCRQTHISIRPSGRWRRLGGRGMGALRRGAFLTPRVGSRVLPARRQESERATGWLRDLVIRRPAARATARAVDAAAVEAPAVMAAQMERRRVGSGRGTPGWATFQGYSMKSRRRGLA